MIVERVRVENEHRLGGLRLDKNERTSEFECEFLDALRSHLTSDLIQSYPNMGLAYELLETLSSLDKQSLLLTAGIDPALRIVMAAFCEKGDSIAITTPTFAMVEIYAKLSDLKIHHVEFQADGRLDFDSLIEKITEGVKLAIVANPSSPIGTCLDKVQMDFLIDLCRRTQTPVLIDEAYVEFGKYSVIENVRDYPNLVVARTFSKAAGLAGIRLGYFQGSGLNLAEMHLSIMQ